MEKLTRLNKTKETEIKERKGAWRIRGNRGTWIRRVLIATKSQKTLSSLTAWPQKENTISKCEETINRQDLKLLPLFVSYVMKRWYQCHICSLEAFWGNQWTEVRMSHNITGSDVVPGTLSLYHSLLSVSCVYNHCVLLNNSDLQYSNGDERRPHTECTPTQLRLLCLISSSLKTVSVTVWLTSPSLSVNLRPFCAIPPAGSVWLKIVCWHSASKKKKTWCATKQCWGLVCRFTRTLGSVLYTAWHNMAIPNFRWSPRPCGLPNLKWIFAFYFSKLWDRTHNTSSKPADPCPIQLARWLIDLHTCWFSAAISSAAGLESKQHWSLSPSF